MRLRGYLNETTKPTVRYTMEALKIAFKKIQRLMRHYDLFDLDDESALILLKRGFKGVGVKLKMGKKGGTRKYLSHGEFGGDYGKDTPWLIELQPGFSKVFKRFAKEKDMKNFLDHNKNPLFRELLDTMSHEVLHADQYINSKTKAFDPDIIGIESTFSGSIEDYLKNPLEVEPYAQQAAIDVIRKGHSLIIKIFKEYFPKNGIIMKKFLKKYAYYMEILKKEGDIKPYKK